MATEKDDMMTCLKILKKEDPTLSHALINQCNSDGWTPLHVASNEGHVDLIELFVEYGSKIDARSRNFRTPLHIASIRGNLGVVQAVLLVGADINAKDIDGNTPCHFCSEYGHKDCLRYLLLKHPSLFSKNKEGLSPLDVAVNTEILSVSFNSKPLSVCRLSKNTSTVSRTLSSQISFRINQNSSTSQQLKLLSQRKPPQLSDLQHQAVVVVALKHLNHNRNQQQNHPSK